MNSPLRVIYRAILISIRLPSRSLRRRDALDLRRTDPRRPFVPASLRHPAFASRAAHRRSTSPPTPATILRLLLRDLLHSALAPNRHAAIPLHRRSIRHHPTVRIARSATRLSYSPLVSSSRAHHFTYWHLYRIEGYPAIALNITNSSSERSLSVATHNPETQDEKTQDEATGPETHHPLHHHSLCCDTTSWSESSRLLASYTTGRVAQAPHHAEDRQERDEGHLRYLERTLYSIDQSLKGYPTTTLNITGALIKFTIDDFHACV